jgi:hypothetical protein
VLSAGAEVLLGASQPPYDQVSPFQPNLAVGASAPAGIAQFDVGADQITSQTRPFDALVYGTGASPLLAPSGQAAPVVPAAPAGWSLARTAASRWEPQAVSTPRICEVH